MESLHAYSKSSRSSRPQRAQRLPALTPAPLSSVLATDTPHKVTQVQMQELTANPKASSRKKPFIAHTFFNRRPLDLIRQTTSSLVLTNKATLSTSATVTPVAVEERKFWPSYRPVDAKSGRQRPLHLQHKQKLQRTVRTNGNTEAIDRERENAVETVKSSNLCTTGKQCTTKDQKARELTAFEQVEILQYTAIYFVSTLAIKRKRCHGNFEIKLPNNGGEVVDDQLNNDGYDDEHGMYSMVIGDHLAYRYEVLSALGQGSFGQVVSCLDHRTRNLVAIKVICNRQRYRIPALEEVKVLAQLNQATAGDEERAHVVCMKDFFEFRNHLCIVFEVLGMNLYDYLKFRHFRGLPIESVRTIALQLVQSLAFLKREQIIHCDLKPENILLDADTVAADGIVKNVTLIDFGSSCLNSAPIFAYIQSRYYRSPEVLLGLPYSNAVDMWSFACILVEMHTGHPIFAGENEQEQLACIMEVLDVPPVKMVRNSKQCLKLFDKVATSLNMEHVDYLPKPYVNSQDRRRIPGSQSLVSAIKSNDLEFVAFITKCLVWNPTERLTPDQALEEPWLRNLVEDIKYK